MKIYINHTFEYEVSNLMKTFYESVEYIQSIEEGCIVNIVTMSDETAIVEARFGERHYKETLTLSADPHEQKRQIKRANARVIYDLLFAVTGKQNKWGTLVGVRPVKIVHALLDAGFSYEDIDKKLYDDHRIFEEKRHLLLDIAKRERGYLQDQNNTDLISLYICIPFCPTRCLYCSFPSNDLNKKGHLVDEYLTCLHKEIDAAYQSILKHNKTVDCIYIGGGTPSILTSQQFEVLLSKLDQQYNLSSLKEFTIEAGRPDTITADKLDVFKKYHVSRLCINPQSMNNKTLNLIGRSHSTDDIKESFELVKSYDFNSVNMDLILGLPDEDLDDVKRTLEAIVALDPENVTIHTLAVKTSSRLKEKLKEYNMSQSELVEEMLYLSEQYMSKHDYYPYYMYRQKNMVGNFENVGYAKEGNESLYNMRIIEEKHNILALGAGAVSKKCYPEEDRFERIANVKGIEDYITRIDDVIKKSQTFFVR